METKEYELRHGDIFIINSKYLFDIFTLSDCKNIFYPVKKFKKAIWYKPRTWFKEYWSIMYLESEKCKEELTDSMLGEDGIPKLEYKYIRKTGN